MTRPTSVWIFNHHAAGRDQGTGTRHLDLGSRLARKGVSVTIFAAGFNHFTGREERLTRGRLVRRQRVEGVDFVWLRTLPYRGNGLGRILNMLSYFVLSLIAQLGRPAPTHVIGSTVHPLAAVAGWVAARRHRAAFYFEIRDLWPQTLVDIGTVRPTSPVAHALYALERFLVERARTVIAVLPGVERYFAERQIRPRSVAYVPNGVVLDGDDDRTTSEASMARRRVLEHRANGRFVAVYAGAHAIHNRLEVVLEAAQRLETGGHADVRIVLVGDGPEKPRLEERCRRLRLRSVELFAPVPKGEIRQILEAADACLLHMTRTPVYRYGISFNKLFDYLASGRPIIFACETSYDPVALARCGISIPPDDPDALCEALVRLSAMATEERSAMGKRGHAYVREHHDIRRLADHLLEVLAA